MKKIILTVAALGISNFLNAAVNFDSVQGKAQHVIAVQNGSTNIGTDAGTSTFPNGGLNTTPTKEIGTDTYKVNPNAPATKPFMAPAFSPPPKFAPAPAFTPPGNQGGTTNTP
jgi:hypothetical protein